MRRRPGRQQCKLARIAAAQALHEPRLAGKRNECRVGVWRGSRGPVVRCDAADARSRRVAEGHNSRHSQVFMNATPPNPSRALRLFAAAVKWSLWLLLAASLLL